MDDYEQIRHLMAEYCFGTDTADTDRWVACFTADVAWNGGAFGSFEGVEAARAYHRSAGDHSLNFRHINTNHLIDVDGDRASVVSYIQVMDQSGDTPVVAFSGFYEDTLVRDGYKWLIKSRILRPTMPCSFK